MEVDRLVALATSGIIASAAFLEATINEFFLDLAEDQLLEDWRTQLDPRRVVLAVALWEETEFKMSRVLEKYQVALRLFDKAPFDRGAPPYQDAATMLDVRNALMHAVPVTDTAERESSSEVATKLENRLRRKFSLPARLATASGHIFPHGLFGGGGTGWAFNSAVALADEFFRRLGVRPRYEGFRERLPL